MSINKPTITPTDWEDSNYYYTYVKWDKGLWNEAHTVKTYTALFKSKAKPKPAASDFMTRASGFLPDEGNHYPFIKRNYGSTCWRSRNSILE